MAKTPPVDAKPRRAVKTRKLGLKRSKKKNPGRKNLQKQGVLGELNGFTVTRLEPEKLKPTRIFPQFSREPSTEAKRVTFAWAEVVQESVDSRTHRANTRRTHSARDSSEDSLNDFEASREPKRRRTIDSDIVEDAEARRATSSMRHGKFGLHHSTPAETGCQENGSPAPKRVFPKTPKPTGSAACGNDTSPDSTFRENEEVGAHEPKVSLASLFDVDTHAGENDGPRSVSNVSSTCPGPGPAMTCEGEKIQLNSDDTTLGLEAIPLNSIETSQLSESNSLGQSCDVTPVRAHSRNTEEDSTLAPRGRSMEKTGRASNQAAEENSTLAPHQGSIAKTGRVSNQAAEESSMLAPHQGSILKTGRVSNQAAEENSTLAPHQESILKTGRVSNQAAEENSTLAPHQGSIAKTGRVSDQVTKGNELVRSLIYEAGADGDLRVESQSNASPRESNSPTKNDSTTSFSSLDEISVSRLSRRDSSSNAAFLKAEDVFKQRRSQLSLDDEEPMEVSMIQAASLPSKFPTPGPDREDEKVSGSDDVELPPGGADPSDAQDAGDETAEPEAVLLELVQNVAELSDPVTLTEALTKENTALGCSVDILPVEPDSGSSKTHSTLVKASCNASFDEDEDAELVALSKRIQKISERDETMETPITEHCPENTVIRDDVAPAAVDLVVVRDSATSEGEPSSVIAIGPSKSTSIPEASSVSEAAAIGDVVPSGEIPLDAPSTPEVTASDRVSSIPDTFLRAPPIPDAAAPLQIPPMSDLSRCDETMPPARDPGQSNECEETSEDVPKAGGGDPLPGQIPERLRFDDDHLKESPEQESDDNFREKSSEEEDRVDKAEETGEPETIAEARLGQDSPPLPESSGEQSTAHHEQIAELKIDSGDAAVDQATETAPATSEQAIDAQSPVARPKRVRRPTKPFSPTSSSTKTTPASSAIKRRTTRSHAVVETPDLVAGTPRTSRRVATRVSSQPTAGARNEETLKVKNGETPAPEPVKAKTVRTPAARSKASRAETVQPEIPSESLEALGAPETPRRAGVSKRAGSKAPKTPITPSKASKATPSAKLVRSKSSPDEEAAATTSPPPPKTSKSTVKSTRVSTAASSRRKAAK